MTQPSNAVLERIARGSRRLELVALAAIVVLVAALTHLVAIILIPRVATEDAYTRLALRNGFNKVSLLAPSRPGDTLIPFRDPATVQGVCFFDVSKGPVRVKTHVEEGELLTLSFRQPGGKVFYSMTDRAAFRDTIDIRLVTPAQLQTIEDDEDTGSDEEVPSELRLKVPAARGLMVATALITRPSERRDAARRIEAITCAPEPLPPPS